jgi:hypothetical protein
MSSAELGAAGLSAGQIRWAVQRGALVSVGRGAYAPAAWAADMARDPGGKEALRVASVLAVAKPGAVGSHRSAANIQGLDLLGRQPPRVTVTRPPGLGSGRGRAGVRVHVAALPDGHVTVRRSVRVTSVARTVVDLARASEFRAAVVTADSALRGKQASKDDLRAVVADCAQWPGICQAHQVVEFSDGRSESALESISRVAFRDHGIPAPELQVWVGGDGVEGRVDFLWRQYRTIGEADGAMKYADTNRAISQLRRDARLRAAGFEVVHFTWDEILRTPWQVAAALREAFRRGGAR